MNNEAMETFFFKKSDAIIEQTLSTSTSPHVLDITIINNNNNNAFNNNDNNDNNNDNASDNDVILGMKRDDGVITLKRENITLKRGNAILTQENSEYEQFINIIRHSLHFYDSGKRENAILTEENIEHKFITLIRKFLDFYDSGKRGNRKRNLTSVYEEEELEENN